MRIKLMTCAIAATAALALAACGGDDDDTSTGTTEASGAETTAEAGGESNAVVATGDTDLGEVLTNAEGLTLYGFMPDEGGTPTCEGECADAWPPLTVDGEQLPAGLDDAEFSVVERSDGTYQLAANDWPLYTFGGDSQPGDVNGQGVGDTWYAVDADGALLRDAEAGGSATTAADSGGDTGY
jgi:predicted lipoprotein with Yx(FWY)xxD motif